MRIAFVTREYPPETAWGGIGSFYASLARSLATAGHEVEVFAQALERESIERDEAGVLVHRVLGHADGLGAKAGGSTAGNDDLGLFSLGLALAMHDAVVERHARAPFDIIEGHDHLGVNAFVNLSALHDAVTVTRYHSAYHTLVRRGLVDWPESRLIQSLEKAALESADCRISTSAVISRAVKEDFGTPPADAVVPNFVQAAPYEGDWSGKKRQVLFVGRLVLGHKRPDLAVQAFVRFAATNPDWTMVVAGPDQDHAELGSVWRYCQSLVPARLAKRVRYAGALSQHEVYGLMAESRVLLAPSDFESFGMVAVEAMQHGCLPVVASDTAMAEIVSDARLIATRGSAAAFANALKAIAADDRAAGDLARRSRERALETFSERRVLGANLAVYDQLLEHRKARSVRRLPAAADADAMTPLVSVVVPNFNGGRFLRETLASIVSQDYTALEIILVDGGSTDDSLHIAAEFPDVVVINEPDKGQAHAINKGLMRARGRILAYLNSDDLYRPGAVRRAVQAFQDDAETLVVSGACDYIDENSAVIGRLEPKFSGVDGIVRYWGWGRWHCIPQQSTFWRRELTERIGLFDVERHFVMDLDYWIRAARLGPIRTVSDTLAAFRLVTGTKTVSRTDQMYGEELQTFYRYRALLPLGRRLLATVEANRHYSERMTGFAEALFLDEGLRRKALYLALVSVKRFPPRLLDVRVWLLIANAAASAMGMSEAAARLHRKALSALWRMRARR